MYHSIVRKNMLILIFSFIPFIVGLGYSVSTSGIRIYLSTAINMAGAQRMRTMLIANYAQQVHAGAAAGEDVSLQREIMEEEIVTYRHFFETLQHGDAELSILENPFPPIALRLSLMNDVVGDYIASAEHLLENPLRADAVRLITTAALAIRDAFHEVTEEYQSANDRMIRRQRVVDMSMLLFASFVTITGLFLTRKIRLQEEGLIAATEQAEAANRAKSDFLANISHELRTPLNGIIGFTNLLGNTPLSAVQRQYVNHANMSGHTLLDMINDVLDFSQIEAGLLELDRMKIDLVELLQNAVDMVKYAADKKGLDVLLQMDPALPRFVVTDPVRLGQILANLLGNAVKFTEKGKVELNVAYQAMENSKGTVSFSVHDTGIGITEEQQKKLFNAFSQVDSSTTRKFGGTGLGLMIANLIAEKMGSTIHIKSTPGEGTTFFFDLIADVEDGECLEKDRDDTTPDTGTVATSTSCAVQTVQEMPTKRKCMMEHERIPRLLVADDELSNIEIIVDIFTEAYEVLFATEGLQALGLIKKSMPDMVLLDVMMPGIDGYEVCRRLKADPATRDIPVIFITSMTREDDETHGFELGAVDYITKPFRAPVVRARVRNHMDLLRARCTIAQTSADRCDMLHLLCHDLTNPFGGIKGICGCSETSEELWERKGLIEDSARNGLEVIDLVRSMLAQEMGKLAIDPLNMSTAFRESREALEFMLIDKDIHLDVDIPPELMVMANKTSLVNSVLNNLLTNAIKFSPRGGTIRVRAKAESDAVLFSIRDYGIGMPPDLCARLFDLKARTSRAGTEGEPGTGFGMPLIKRFMRLYEGGIEVHSSEVSESPSDHGTEIILTFAPADTTTESIFGVS